MKADYSKIAHTYDAAHPASQMAIERVLSFLEAKVGRNPKLKFLDLGCGTGRFAIPIAKKFNYCITGADKSAAMLDKARSKDGAEKVTWDLQNATALSYEDNQFDVVFMSHLLHHFDQPELVIKECHRVLVSGGLLLNRYGAIEDVLEDPEHKFFPEIRDIDRKRTPTKKQMKDWFKQTGFEAISSQSLEQRTFACTGERVAAIEKRYISALWLISDPAFSKGLQDLKKYISLNPDDKWLSICKITFTHGVK